MMKNMDKNFMKNMYKQQMNMDLTDQQIEMMQNMMTPEMIESMKGMNMEQMGMGMPQQQ